MALARRIRVYFTPLTIQFVCQKVGRAGVEKVTTGLHGEGGGKKENRFPCEFVYCSGFHGRGGHVRARQVQ